ncbi:hypothetical protein AB0P12_32285 [Streptomyces subrutilus]|uniref:hypothetical protein n=1 Tax=Streptomyces subrutilus TaxID=36818 RepID=UPI00342D3D03
MPQALFDAVLEASLTPLAAYRLHPEPEEGWEAMSSYGKDWSMEMGGRSAWAMLAQCPERWAQPVTHPTLGAAVQHLLLDQAEIQAAEDARNRAAGYLPGEDPEEELPAADPARALSEELLLACLLALCLPELADLRNPKVTARRTLYRIARRVDTNPRLAHLAAEQLAEAADKAVVRGQLLTLPEKKDTDYEFEGRVRDLAEDLVLLSTNADHLGGACAQLATPGPAGRRLPPTEPDLDPRLRRQPPRRPRPPGPAPGTPQRATPCRDPGRARRQPARRRHRHRHRHRHPEHAAPRRTGLDRREDRRPGRSPPTTSSPATNPRSR